LDKAIADEKALESASDVLPEKIAPAVMTDKAWSHAEGFNEAILIAEPILAKQILKVKELENSMLTKSEFKNIFIRVFAKCSKR